MQCSATERNAKYNMVEVYVRLYISTKKTVTGGLNVTVHVSNRQKWPAAA